MDSSQGFGQSSKTNIPRTYYSRSYDNRQLREFRQRTNVVRSQSRTMPNGTITQFPNYCQTRGMKHLEVNICSIHVYMFPLPLFYLCPQNTIVRKKRRFSSPRRNRHCDCAMGVIPFVIQLGQLALAVELFVCKNLNLALRYRIVLYFVGKNNVAYKTALEKRCHLGQRRELLTDISALKYVLEVFFLFNINFALYTCCSTLSSFCHLSSYRRISRLAIGSRKLTCRFFQPNVLSLPNQIG